jgi:hypothetical protein
VGGIREFERHLAMNRTPVRIFEYAADDKNSEVDHPSKTRANAISITCCDTYLEEFPY